MSDSDTSLQCIDTVKRTPRAPSIKNIEAAAISPSHSKGHHQRKRESKKRFYDTTIVEEKGSQDDERKPRIPKPEAMSKKPKLDNSCIGQDYSPFTELACSIKKRLLASIEDDPEVIIQVPLNFTSFRFLQERGILRLQRGRSGTELYTIREFSDLNDLFGEKWHMRIENILGDFSYVILETVSFYFSRSRPIMEYEVEKGDDGMLKCIPVCMQQSNSVVFTFVRGDGNRRELLEFL